MGGIYCVPNRESAVDAQVVKLGTTEPTFGTSLDQVRRKYWVDDEKADGLGGPKNILLRRVAARMQMESDFQLAKLEKEIRLKMSLLEIEHEGIERAHRHDLELKLARESMIKFVRDLADVIAKELNDLGICDPEVEAAVRRIYMMKLEATAAEMFK